MGGSLSAVSRGTRTLQYADASILGSRNLDDPQLTIGGQLRRECKHSGISEKRDYRSDAGHDGLEQLLEPIQRARHKHVRVPNIRRRVSGVCDRHIQEPESADSFLQKDGPLATRLDEQELTVRPHTRQREPREPGARTYVYDSATTGGRVFENCRQHRGFEEVKLGRFCRIDNSSEIELPIPGNK